MLSIAAILKANVAGTLTDHRPRFISRPQSEGRTPPLSRQRFGHLMSTMRRVITPPALDTRTT